MTTRSRRTPNWLWILLIVVSLALLAVIPLGAWLFQQDLPPFNVVIDGSEQVHTIHLGALSIGHKLALVAAVFAGLVALLIAVPVALATVLVGVVIALVLGIGLPLFIFAVMVLVMLSPVLLLVAMLRWIWRSSARRETVSARLPVA
jgi:hypothetical protein